MGCAIILKKHSFYSREHSNEVSRPKRIYMEFKKNKNIIKSYELKTIDEAAPSEESSIYIN